MNQELVERIMRQPDAPLLIQQLNERLGEEHARRLSFYEWIDEHTKAEFINGEIVVHSPVRRVHWKITDLLSSLLSIYVRINKLGIIGTEKVMIALTRNDYEPDIVFFNIEKAAVFEADQVLFPAPDFVVEVLSKKTQKTDRTTKKEDYAAHGIPEYWIIDPDKERIEQYLLLNPTDKVYFEPYIFLRDDEITSKAIPGFTIPVKAVFDEQVNMTTLQELMKG